MSAMQYMYPLIDKREGDAGPTCDECLYAVKFKSNACQVGEDIILTEISETVLRDPVILLPEARIGIGDRAACVKTGN